MAQLMMCPGCKEDLAPGEQYCRNACFLTPVPKRSAEPAHEEPTAVDVGPACGDPDCPHGGRAPAAGCRACGLSGTSGRAAPVREPGASPAATTLRFAWGPVTVDAAEPLIVGRESSPLASRILDGYSNVSRRHAEIRSDGTTLTVVDLGSMNGTFVNDRRLEPRQATPLRAGDRVRFAARLEATVTGETA